MQKIIALVKSLGYRVFIRPDKYDREVTYCFYTDGTRIAYAEWCRHGFRESVSSVHMANRTTGTGYMFDDQINAETLAGALNCHAPQWARHGDAATVRKWKDWDTFHQSSKFHAELTEI